MSDTQKTGLDSVFAVGDDSITVGGENLKILPANLGQIAKAIKCGRALVAVWNTAKAEGQKINWLRVILDDPDAALDTAAALIGKERSWIDKLSIDDAATLAVRVFEANLDFFTNRLPALAQQISERAEQMAKKAQIGAGSSSG